MKGTIIGVVVIVAGVLVIGLLFGIFLADVLWHTTPPVAQTISPTPQPVAQPSGGVKVMYQQPDLNQAPKDLQEAVLYGATIMTDTQKVLADHVGNKLNCSNCHFEAGATEGGKNGGISLVGVAATYPKYRDRQKYAVNLVTRVND